MTIEVNIQLMVFALAFAMLMIQQVWGDADCYDQKEAIKYRCRKTITIVGPYREPTSDCRHTVQASDMVCICEKITLKEQGIISVVKLVQLARECGNPVPPGTHCGLWEVPPPLSPPPHHGAHP
ncbi:hypothetical protein BS78_10G009500 [Paspalum vaginatum]|nr:hypothetical protein BS78_10G009500 [Paspalum vaginatum]